ncbi:MAG: hypothetical protein EFT35_03360 [Methanophagales archaeon ANME-1-THS]|nr:MAG: hypothetical protein EFT35_03360 [Methanophagales archaeon ANME-1-THS]
MAELKIKIPKELEEEMSKIKWIDWSLVAVKAISERLEDVKELELERQIAELSEIPAADNREVKESLAKEVVKSTEEVLREIKAGRKKPMTLEEFNDWCGEL